MGHKQGPTGNLTVIGPPAQFIQQVVRKKT